MEQVIIQYGVKQGRIAELVRSHGEDILIGRGFNNQLVIQDDYIAPQQLRIFQQENQTWWVEILEQTNSVLLNGKAKEDGSFQIRSGDRITIGRTTLSVYSAEHKVEKTRKLLTRSLHQESISLTLPLILLVLLSAFDIALEHFVITPQESLTTFVTTSLLSAFIVLIWVSLWALAGRIFRHNSHFGQQLLATTLILFALSILGPWPQLVEFTFSSTSTGTVLNYLLAFTCFALLLKFHLLFATNLRRTGAIALSISALVVGGSASYQYYQQSEFSYEANYSQVIRPSFMHLGSDLDMSEYLKQTQQVLDAIDKQNVADKQKAL
ncbi:hypothetical protein A9R00_01810 [Oleispira antarctica]|uniref:FHA domain-containing protein n=1 Tax=Oleispira antarctica TaxID=188908 RepID=A0A1Y5I299_OLEAN|nr:hypothetical protein A9R00_01810 [Oleispira antarctica]